MPHQSDFMPLPCGLHTPLAKSDTAPQLAQIIAGVFGGNGKLDFGVFSDIMIFFPVRFSVL